MGERSAIQWTDATYNPWRGCDKVSPGCAHCYMFTDQRRYGCDPSIVVRCSDSTFYAPLRKREWRALAPGSLVFTCSWSDWFHETADQWRDEAWDVIRQRPDLTWQILTKRPERIRDHLPADWGDGWPNVWMGVSIENRRFVGRADLLRQVPVAVRFISAEPLLGPLVYDVEVLDQAREPIARTWDDGYDGPPLDLDAIDWIIVGGESGPGARLMEPAWALDIIEGTLHRGAPAVFVKQLGKQLAGRLELRDRTHGGDPREWPLWLQVREMPGETQRAA